jgi:5'-3' exonuclease
MRLHLVDGTYELFRGHYSKQPARKTADGQDVKATVAMVSSILSLLSDPRESVTHVAVAFDNPIRSFRNDLFDGYKTEEGVSPELLGQFDFAELSVQMLGVTVWSMDQWEADDALATAAARWRDEVEQVRILSPDKDFGQCIRGNKVVQVDRQRHREIDEQGVRTVRGVGPESIPDLLALVGDDADGIPGLPGFGYKTAALLLSQYEHVENIPTDARLWSARPARAEQLAQVLADHREAVLLYRRLARLVEDVPLREQLDDLRWLGVRRQAFYLWCDSLGLSDLKLRPQKWQGDLAQCGGDGR